MLSVARWHVSWWCSLRSSSTPLSATLDTSNQPRRRHPRRRSPMVRATGCRRRRHKWRLIPLNDLLSSSSTVTRPDIVRRHDIFPSQTPLPAATRQVLFTIHLLHAGAINYCRLYIRKIVSHFLVWYYDFYLYESAGRFCLLLFCTGAICILCYNKKCW